MENQTAAQSVVQQETAENIYDLLIVGGGMAGLTAAIYAGRAGLRTLALESQIPGGSITTSELVENWPSQLSITGIALGELLQKQTEKCGARIEWGIVQKLNKLEDTFVLTLDSGAVLQSRTVIYAAGVNPRRLGIPGEQEFRGRGVSYCATCDGPFYKQKNVVVIGGGSSAVQEALYLSSLARTVTLVHRRENFRAEKILLDRARSRANLIFKTPFAVSGILGEGGALTGVSLQNVLTGETETLPGDGVFIYAGVEPNTGLLRGLVKLTEDGYVAAGEDTRTSVPGLFAAGDVRVKELRQLVTAAADGAVAATQAGKYLQELKF
ncbi:MAG: FAD-dependent oxidoreductase [Candidatus Margulisbacteria bacterium]|jgi:thioredoxin reductase (NADPH)|nr:FAD-dependent oxidoreductase [Candidatus Margulisiibacteriota bacterium]